ncbi:NUDIX hydrolase [Sediminibacterium ginsengisoli]|uniref:ADP-ribose pyrophosphatase YjhB, NUDIX family n=1 Tax=Sediminibacterium ginsengisoli TaxID=413434 RepID=A0A1T4QSS3_9BACT|nr:NUDIX domain-containing protein [Sediminibacterium ginsengisoli]SKA06744.1 ADP-ribose pyrophosphatase YjhB, NUDIX family [Sediminibacterium ginsengisoli]
MSSVKKLHTSGLVVLRNRKLLLAFSNKKKAFYLPGGKTENDETAELSLIREIREELSLNLEPGMLHYYCHISAPAYGETEGIQMEQECFLCDLLQEPVAAAEIGSIRYFSLADYEQEPCQVPGVLLVFEQLKKDDLAD